MTSERQDPPLIVIGMHRSGTSMVTRALQELGVFMGADLSHNAESELIVALNDWLLWQGSGAWDHPEPFLDVLEAEPVREMSADYLRTMLSSPRSAAFVGRSRALRGATVRRLEGPWGLKDPRLTYTLPIWLDLWPDARVVCVSRHGVDVASSLKARVDKRMAADRDRYLRRRLGYLLKPKHQRLGRLVPTLRCSRLEGGLALWDEYATQAARHVAELADRALHLRYEDFVRDPLEGVGQLSRFCGVDASEHTLSGVAGRIEGGRALAFQGRAELASFSRRADVATTLERHGYAPAAAGADGAALRAG